jgi:mono/diheme cytochrome c family protein
MRSSLAPLMAVCCALAANPASAAEPVDYAKQIKPILSARCYACHGALQQKSKLRTDTVKALIEGGDGGPAIEPGKSGESPLVALIRDKGEGRMPPPSEGETFNAEQIALIEAWIDQGAIAPSDDAPEPDPRNHWAFRAPIRAPVPILDGARSGNPIDAFLSAALSRPGRRAAHGRRASEFPG